jgi:hypothetical protein
VRRWIVRGLAAVAVLLSGLAVYGVLVEPRLILDVDRVEVALPRLDDRLAGTEVAVLSDLQVGMWWANTGMVERAVRRAVDARPDVVLLGGDLVYSTSPGVARQVDTVLGLLEPLLAADVPTYAVLGNHDLAAGAADELTAALEDAGIPVLTNESVAVPGGSGPDGLYVVGLGPALRDVADAGEALDDVPAGAARVVLAHNPTVFPDLPPRQRPAGGRRAHALWTGGPARHPAVLPGTQRRGGPGGRGVGARGVRAARQPAVRHLRAGLQPSPGAHQRPAGAGAVRAATGRRVSAPG